MAGLFTRLPLRQIGFLDFMLSRFRQWLFVV